MCTGEPSHRVQIALTEMGSSVFSGALTTFLGVLVLVFGSVEITRIFAKLICMLILLSAFYGLVVSPVLLLYVGKKWKSISTIVDIELPTFKSYALPAQTSHLPTLPEASPGDAKKKMNCSLQQLHIDASCPDPRTSEYALKNAAALSSSMSVLPHHTSKLKTSFRSTARSSSTQTLPTNRHSVDIAPLYLAVKVRSDSEVPDTSVPLSGSIRCESSI